MTSRSTPSAESEPRRLGFRNPSLAFVVQAAAWVLLLFALVRLPWVEQRLLLPFAGFQGRIACALAGTPPNSVFVGLSCTGADPMALVLGAVLAFPVAWRRRIGGAALGLGLILVLNTARIGSLSLVIDQRLLFERLHLYVWPAILIIAAAAYVFLWMGFSLRESGGGRARRDVENPLSGRQTIRFVALTSVLVTAFFLLSPWLMTSAAVLEVARWAAVIAAAVMAVLGISVEVAGNTLRTNEGAWIVTQACVATPLIPVYLSAVALLPTSALRRSLAALAAVPLFLLLGSARLLVLALPAAVVGSHATAVHAFYQILAAVVVVLWLAWRSSSPVATALRALAAGSICAYCAGWIGRAWLWPAAERLRESLHLGHAWIDDQGALAIMPAFQLGLFLALWIALRRPVSERSFLAGLVFVLLSQIVMLVLAGELAVHGGVEIPVAGIRAASLVLPLVTVWWSSVSRPVPLAGGAEGIDESAAIGT